MNSIFHRTSVRQYLEREVEQEKIEQILKSAMAAPSAMNQQPWEFYVVTDKEKIGELSKSTPYSGCVKGAPLAFVLCMKKELPALEFAPLDMSAALENMLLTIDELGLGAVWIGVAPVPERIQNVERILGISDDLQAFAVVPCGYPVKVNPQQDRYDSSRVHYVR